MFQNNVEISFLDNAASFHQDKDRVKEDMTRSIGQDNHNLQHVQAIHYDFGSNEMAQGLADIDFKQTAEFFYPDFQTTKNEEKQNHKFTNRDKDKKQEKMVKISKKDTTQENISIMKVNSLNNYQSESNQRILGSRSQPRLHQQPLVKPSRLQAQRETRLSQSSFKEDKQHQQSVSGLKKNNSKLTTHHGHSSSSILKEFIDTDPTFCQQQENQTENNQHKDDTYVLNNYLFRKQNLDSVKYNQNSLNWQPNQGKQLNEPKKILEVSENVTDQVKPKTPSRLPVPLQFTSSNTQRNHQQESIIQQFQNQNLTTNFNKNNSKQQNPNSSSRINDPCGENPEKNLFDEVLLESLKKQQILYNRIRSQQAKHLDGFSVLKSSKTQHFESTTVLGSDYQDSQQSLQNQIQQQQQYPFPLLKQSQSSKITLTQPSRNNSSLRNEGYLRKTKPLFMDSIVPDSIYNITKYQMTGFKSSGNSTNNQSHNRQKLDFSNNKVFNYDVLSTKPSQLRKSIDLEDQTKNINLMPNNHIDKETNSRKKFYSMHQGQLPLASSVPFKANSHEHLTNDLENARNQIRNTISKGNGYKVLQQFQTNYPNQRKLTSPTLSLPADGKFIFFEDGLISTRESRTADTGQINKLNEIKLKTFLQRKPQENILNRIFNGQIELIEQRE